MRKPKLNNLTLDTGGTKRLRNLNRSQKSIKITININAATLSEFKALAEETGIPYQRLINKTLSTAVTKSQGSAEARLNKLEKELLAIKKKLAA
jgi:predicted DNA binding CopG/RHH family protein